MKTRASQLQPVISTTILLLVTGATLVVLGIFNEFLNWDIFGPKLEAFLYGVFASCMALAGFGVVISLVLAIREAVRDFHRLVDHQTTGTATGEAPSRGTLKLVFLAGLIIAGFVVTCSLANQVVLSHRSKVFKRIADQQGADFTSRILAHEAIFTEPPQTNIPPDFYTVMKSLQDLDFVNRLTLYLPDRNDSLALWQFSPGYNYSTNEGFNRLYAAKDVEKSILAALNGDVKRLETYDAEQPFDRYRPLQREGHPPLAVLRMSANPRANFREYPLGK